MGFPFVCMLMRDITSDIHLIEIQDMQLQWRKANNQSPVTSPITILGYHTTWNPLPVMLILAVFGF